MSQQTNYSSYILPVGGVMALLLVLNKFGLLPSASKEKEAQQVQELDTLAEFKPGYTKKLMQKNGWSKVKQTLLPAAGAAALAAQLKKSKGVFNDNELAVFSVFKTLRNKAQLSQLALTFQNEYSLDVVEFLRSFLNDSELARIYSIVQPLPTGVKPIS